MDSEEGGEDFGPKKILKKIGWKFPTRRRHRGGSPATVPETSNHRPPPSSPTGCSWREKRASLSSFSFLEFRERNIVSLWCFFCCFNYL